MSIAQWMLLALAVVLLAVALVPVAVTLIEHRQAGQLQGLLPYSLAASSQKGRTAVVYFSRSGNTALAARHVARRLDAQLFPLAAQDYELGLVGWGKAMRDARNHNADISPRIIDLAAFDTIYLGSPIWLYSPAPPIWAFVENHRFEGKRVVLFNTFNSEFKPEYIEAFKAKVMQRGARSFEHRYIQRGRMTQQLTPEEMLQAIDKEWFLE